jgi:hypothetical protein
VSEGGTQEVDARCGGGSPARNQSTSERRYVDVCVNDVHQAVLIDYGCDIVVVTPATAKKLKLSLTRARQIAAVHISMQPLDIVAPLRSMVKINSRHLRCENTLRRSDCWGFSAGAIRESEN